MRALRGAAAGAALHIALPALLAFTDDPAVPVQRAGAAFCGLEVLKLGV